jgi:hypothetical protein
MKRKDRKGKEMILRSRRSSRSLLRLTLRSNFLKQFLVLLVAFRNSTVSAPYWPVNVDERNNHKL